MLNIPPQIEAYLKPSAEKKQQMMLAQGLIPLPPATQIHVTSMLLANADTEIVDAARRTLNEIPANILKTVLRETESPIALDFYAREKTNEESILEAILLNPRTPDEVYLLLASNVSEKLANLILNNQVRLLSNIKIAENLKKNPHVLRSSVDTMISFLRMNGIILEGESAELTPQEVHDLLNFQEPSFELPPELLKDDAEVEALTEEKRQSIYQLVQDMNVASKIKLALKGNKEARSILIKDSNKIVASAVVKSPRITDGEVYNICLMKTTHDEVIRIICGKNEWIKNYSVQVALAANPKTPFPIALKFTKQLRLPDLIKLSKNKNAPNQLLKIAKEIAEQKKR